MNFTFDIGLTMRGTLYPVIPRSPLKPIWADPLSSQLKIYNKLDSLSNSNIKATIIQMVRQIAKLTRLFEKKIVFRKRGQQGHS